MSHPAPLRIKIVPPDVKRTARILGVTSKEQKLISELIDAHIAKSLGRARRQVKRSAIESGRTRPRSARGKRASA